VELALALFGAYDGLHDQHEVAGHYSRERHYSIFRIVVRWLTPAP
jgi:hypothetical protein